jgi:enamine deaminase RidA (YjgF/YER057c/UK114 family)
VIMQVRFPSPARHPPGRALVSLWLLYCGCSPSPGPVLGGSREQSHPKRRRAGVRHSGVVVMDDGNASGGSVYPGVPYDYGAVAPPRAMLFTAGACPLDVDGRVVARGDHREQARIALGHLIAVLRRRRRRRSCGRRTRPDRIALRSRHVGRAERQLRCAGLAMGGHPDRRADATPLAAIWPCCRGPDA